jgi:hypothetical protein
MKPWRARVLKAWSGVKSGTSSTGASRLPLRTKLVVSAGLPLLGTIEIVAGLAGVQAPALRNSTFALGTVPAGG